MANQEIETEPSNAGDGLGIEDHADVLDDILHSTSPTNEQTITFFDDSFPTNNNGTSTSVTFAKDTSVTFVDESSSKLIKAQDVENQMVNTVHSKDETFLTEEVKDDSCDSPGSNHHKPNHYSLRWSRLVKTVSVQENRTGLVRSSIAGPQHDSNDSDGNNKKSKGPIQKTIMNQVSGHADPGNVMALIGPSGSSKTTLLNTLSGRGTIDSGDITVNGKPLRNYLSKIAYVRQEDIFFEHLTVRDQLAYTAFLRMPQHWSRESKLEEVDQVIRVLRLRKVQTSQINMLSGGEKKRVNIGTELLTNPSCLLLDEPTSGLDSTSAASLVKLLQNLARSQAKTIIMSIHQPSSGMFLDFDSLTILAEGHVVYFGTPEGSIHYLKQRNFPCREGYNIADHWMDLLVTDTTMEEEEEMIKSAYFSSADLRMDEDDDENDNDNNKYTASATTANVGLRNRKKSPAALAREAMRTKRRSTRQQLIEFWDGESVALQVDEQAKQDLSKNESDMATKSQYGKYNTGWAMQYRVLMHRALKNSRSAIFTPLNMIKSAVIGIVSGLLWFQLEYTEKTSQDRVSYFFFTMTYWVFDSMFGALLAFPSERKVILKERASASYHLSAYFMAKTTSEAPTRLTLPLLYMTISFWLAGISSRFSAFVFTTLISLLSVLAGESYGLLIGASVDQMDRAMTMITIVALSMMLLGGFYVDNVPDFVAWARYLSPFKYAFDASRSIIFDRPVPCDGSGTLQHLCSDGQESASPEDIKVLMDVDGSLGLNVGMLVVLGLVPRYFAYLALKAKKDKGRG